MSNYLLPLHLYQAFRDMFADEDVRNLEAYPVEEDEINELKNDIPLGTFYLTP